MKREIVKKTMMLLAISGMIFSGCGKEEKTYVPQKKTETEISKSENDSELETETEGISEGKNYKITTEYDLEDYASGYVIVSKNDGLLYGVIDKDGNEVIPVEYDNIQLVRGEEEESDSFIFVTVDYWAEGYQYELYSIDENGNLTDLGDLESQNKYSLSSAGQIQVNEESSSSENSSDYTLGKNGEYRLYQTNDTWKLEDSNGNPLYDKRYFECWHKEDCFFLLNEDNQICLINKNGQMLVDYGTITWNGEYGMFGDSEITDDSIRSDGNSVCFEVAGDDENILYIFFPEEEK